MGALSDGAEYSCGEANGGECADPDGSCVEAELPGPLTPSGNGACAHACRRNLADPPPQCGASGQGEEPTRRTGDCGNADHRKKRCTAEDEDEAEDSGKGTVGEKQNETARGEKPGTDRETHEPTLTGKGPFVRNDATGHGALATTR